MRILLGALLSALAVSACTVGRLHQAAPVSSVTADRLTEFEYRRVHSAAGQFITEEVLAATGDLPLIDVLRARIRGFGMGRGLGTSCAFDLYVNGLRAGDVLDTVHPRDLMGVEYYEATSAPVKYRRAFSTCPVLLLWLK